MTEDEAKTKMCPLLPVAYGPNSSPILTAVVSPHNYSAGSGTVAVCRQFNCVGSNCMMWTGSGCGLVRQS